MVKFKNLTDNDDVTVKIENGNMRVLEYRRDLSVTSNSAQNAYYMAKMGVRKKQLLLNLDGTNTFIVQAGAMQWMAGKIQMTTGIKGAGDLIKKSIGGRVTGESTVKPEYKGFGQVMLEPTYKHILIEEVGKWGGLVLTDGMFLACDGTIQQKVVARKNISSATLGGEGLFNLCLRGNGLAALESPVPREELIAFVLDNDEVKIDGPYAVAWSESLDFTVERSSRSLIGSAAAGEGLVNVYRGSGVVLMAPVG